MVPGLDVEGDPLGYKDAIFLSPHKFIGGPSTPDVLAVRRDLARNSVPVVPGALLCDCTRSATTQTG